MECFVQKLYFKLNLVTLEFRAQLFGDRSVTFMTGEVLCGHVGVILFMVVTLSVTFTGTTFRISTCISF